MDRFIVARHHYSYAFLLFWILFHPAISNAVTKYRLHASGDYIVVVANNSKEEFLFQVDLTTFKSSLVSHSTRTKSSPLSDTTQEAFRKQYERMGVSLVNTPPEKYYSPDSKYVLIGHRLYNGGTSIGSVDLVRVDTNAVVTTVRFEEDRSIEDMLWLPDGKYAVFLDVVNHYTLLTYLIGHNDRWWEGDIYVHVLERETGKITRIEVAKNIRKPEVVLELDVDER